MLCSQKKIEERKYEKNTTRKRTEMELLLNDINPRCCVVLCCRAMSTLNSTFEGRSEREGASECVIFESYRTLNAVNKLSLFMIWKQGVSPLCALHINDGLQWLSVDKNWLIQQIKCIPWPTVIVTLENMKSLQIRFVGTKLLFINFNFGINNWTRKGESDRANFIQLGIVACMLVYDCVFTSRCRMYSQRDRRSLIWSKWKWKRKRQRTTKSKWTQCADFVRLKKAAIKINMHIHDTRHRNK